MQSIWRGWRFGICWVAMASLLSSSNCNSIWEPFLVNRCPNGDACGLDMVGSGSSDLPSRGASDSAGMPPALFGPATNFPVESGPNSVAVGDFNRDMKLDLAVANVNSDNVSVLLGNGLGGFGAAVNFPVGSSPNSVVVGDFNGDLKLDLVSANTRSNNVSVLLGNGLGGFAAASNFPVGSLPSSVAVGDFNSDLKPDLAIANFQSNNVSVLLGNGTGGFGTATNFPVGTYADSVAVGDFNGDLKPDLAVANRFNVDVLLGNGAGSFDVATNFPVGDENRWVAVGDFDGDLKPDLAVAVASSRASSQNSIGVLLGNGAGGFGAATYFPVGTSPFSVAVGDFNGDLNPDVAVANGNSGNVSVLLNQSP